MFFLALSRTVKAERRENDRLRVENGLLRKSVTSLQAQLLMLTDSVAKLQAALTKAQKNDSRDKKGKYTKAK